MRRGGDADPFPGIGVAHLSRPNVIGGARRVERMEMSARVRRERGQRVAPLNQVQVRCAGCNRRLADLVNEVALGQVILEVKCPRCRHPHLEVIRPVVPLRSLPPHRKEVTRDIR